MRLFHLSTRNAEPVEKSRVSRLFIIVGYTFIIIIFFCSLVNAKSRALDATTGTHALAIDSSSFSFIPFKVCCAPLFLKNSLEIRKNTAARPWQLLVNTSARLSVIYSDALDDRLEIH